MHYFPFSDIRQKFEAKREKLLNFSEKKIFRNIAIDYAKRRMEVLEKDTAAQLAAKGIKTSEVPVKALHQKRKYDQTSKENETNKEKKKGYLSVPTSKVIVGENENVIPGRKFTFGHSRNVENSSDIVGQQTDESHTKSICLSKVSVNPDRQKEEMPLSRNALALLDSHVTPKEPRKRRSKKTDNKQLKQESLIGKWVTPINKKHKEKAFQHSVRKQCYFDNDSSDSNCIIEDNSSSTLIKQTPLKPTSISHHESSSISRTANGMLKGDHLGAAPTNKYGTAVRIGERSMSSDDKQRWVQCPLCSSE